MRRYIGKFEVMDEGYFHRVMLVGQPEGLVTTFCTVSAATHKEAGDRAQWIAHALNAYNQPKEAL